jgi:hypothetical protein
MSHKKSSPQAGRAFYSVAASELVAVYFISVVRLELLFKIFGIFGIAGLYTHHNTTILDAFFVLSSVLLGNARAHQRTY